MSLISFSLKVLILVEGCIVRECGSRDFRQKLRRRCVIVNER